MKETNTKDLDTGQYDKKSYGLGVGFGVPMNEFDTVRIGFDVDMSDITLVDASPQRYKDYCKDVSGGDSSGCDQNEAVLSVGYSSDKRDSAIYPRAVTNMILVLKLHYHCLICSIIRLMQKLLTIPTD